MAPVAGELYAGSMPADFIEDRRRVRQEYEEYRAWLEALFTVIPQRPQAYGRHGSGKTGCATSTYMADGRHWPGTWFEPTENHNKTNHASIVQVPLQYSEQNVQISFLWLTNDVGVGRDLLCDPQNLENENEYSESHENGLKCDIRKKSKIQENATESN
jgi:hypothetical protein